MKFISLGLASANYTIAADFDAKYTLLKQGKTVYERVTPSMTVLTTNGDFEKFQFSERLHRTNASKAFDLESGRLLQGGGYRTVSAAKNCCLETWHRSFLEMTRPVIGHLICQVDHIFCRPNMISHPAAIAGVTRNDL